VAFSRRTGRSRPTLIVLVLSSVTVLALGLSGAGPVTGLRSTLDSMLEPVRSSSDGVLRPVADGWKGITGYGRLKKENDQLRRQLDQAKGSQARDRLLEDQVAKLKRLMNVKFAADVPRVTARVVSGPLSSFDRTVEIDRGSGDGLRKGMAVITYAGLAGRVKQADPGRSVISLVTDPAFKVGYLLPRSQAIGIARGDGLNKSLIVDDGSIDSHAQVHKGDDVYTSGIDQSAFPPDVPIGKVAAVHKVSDGTQQNIEIDPNVDLGSLSYVQVLLRNAA
jgi:rod shape-determining protein MreC